LLDALSSPAAGATPLKIYGSHHTIYACSLPLWLPDDVVEHMVNTFGKILQDVLRELVLSSFKPSRTSGDSAGLSVSSSREHINNAPPPLAQFRSPYTFMPRRAVALHQVFPILKVSKTIWPLSLLKKKTS